MKILSKLLPSKTFYFFVDFAWKSAMLWAIWNYGLAHYVRKIPHLDFLFCLIVIVGLWAMRTVMGFTRKIAIVSALALSGTMILGKENVMNMIGNLMGK